MKPNRKISNVDVVVAFIMMQDMKMPSSFSPFQGTPILYTASDKLRENSTVVLPERVTALQPCVVVLSYEVHQVLFPTH